MGILVVPPLNYPPPGLHCEPAPGGGMPAESPSLCPQSAWPTGIPQQLLQLGHLIVQLNTQQSWPLLF